VVVGNEDADACAHGLPPTGTSTNIVVPF